MKRTSEFTVFETSAKTGHNIEEAFMFMAAEI